MSPHQATLHTRHDHHPAGEPAVHIVCLCGWSLTVEGYSIDTANMCFHQHVTRPEGAPTVSP